MHVWPSFAYACMFTYANAKAYVCLNYIFTYAKLGQTYANCEGFRLPALRTHVQQSLGLRGEAGVRLVT